MSNKLEKLQWRSFNCYSSAVGSILSYYNLPYISSALDSSWDFYYNPNIPIQKSGTGVWPGPEHEAIKRRVRSIYGIDLEISNNENWSTFINEIETSNLFTHPILIVVKNKTFDYIPIWNVMDTVAHYLVILECKSSKIEYYDSFFDRFGTISLKKLKNAMYFKTSDGTLCKNRVCRFKFDQTCFKKDFYSKQYIDKYTIVNSFLNPALSDLMCEQNGVIYGSEAIKRLAADIVDISNDKIKHVLYVLSWCFKDVHYQRNFFINSMEVIQNEFPESFERVQKIIHEINDIVKMWFRIKTLALYIASKESGKALQTLSKCLFEVAIKEKHALIHMNGIKHELLSRSCTYSGA